MSARRVRIIALLAALIAVGGCQSFQGFGERSRNREGIASLKFDMTKEEVRKLLGPPLEKEKYHEEDVWFYYTDWQWADGSVTSDECTPLIFDKGRLVGWGQPALKKYRQANWR